MRGRSKGLLFGVALYAAAPLHAQPWTPTRNIEIIVSSGAGGAADREARELQRHLQKRPGMPPITVNNRPGGGGSIAWTALNQHQGDAHWIATANVALLTNHILGASQLHYRGSVGPGGLSAAQRAYWDATFSTVVNTPEWKATAMEHAWEPDYKHSSEASQYLATAYDNLKKILSELGVTRPTQ